jgi:uncharacterized membrane protein YeaQ/YmgE (transglycosylase-associated protein family)
VPTLIGTEEEMMEEQIGAGIGIVAGLLILAVFGGIVGWIASLLIKGTGLGLVGDIILGIVGSVVGGWLFQALGLSIGGGIIGAFVPALVGAVAVLLIVKAIKRA